MGPLEPARLDPRLTFERYVVGAGNRLAVAAARRAAEAPGVHYNPLYFYSASGLGKSHLLHAMAHHAQSVDGSRRVFYQSPEAYLEGLARALKAGAGDEAHAAFRRTDLLLLDDIQFLAGQPEAQEMLLRTLDALTASGAQVVLASDRPPAEIDGLDERLLSRFSGGLLVDIGDPDFETRVGIVERRAEDRGAVLAPGVAQALARPGFRNVRELQGTLNRLLAVQDLEGRTVQPHELALILGPRFALPEDSDLQVGIPSGPIQGPAGERAHDLKGHDPRAQDLRSHELRTQEPRARRIRGIYDGLRSAGYETVRIAPLLETVPLPSGWRDVLDGVRTDVEALRAIEAELAQLGNPWPENALALLRNPDKRAEAEDLIQWIRDLALPLPVPGPGPVLEELTRDFPPLALRAVDELLRSNPVTVNPLYVHSPSSGRAQAFLEAAIRSDRVRHPGRTVASVSVTTFADGFVEAVERGTTVPWRDRWANVDVLLLHGVEGFAATERIQEEFFHLFEGLHRRGGRILLSASVAPEALEGIQERIRSRFEGGLVVELGEGPIPA